MNEPGWTWSFKSRGRADLGEAADRVAHAVWEVVTAQPTLSRLYPGYWVAIRSVVGVRLREAAVPAARCDSRCPVLKHLSGCGDLPAFSRAVADDVVRGLEEVLRDEADLPAVAAQVPRAVQRALAVPGTVAPAAPPGARPAPVSWQGPWIPG